MTASGSVRRPQHVDSASRSGRQMEGGQRAPSVAELTPGLRASDLPPASSGPDHQPVCYRLMACVLRTRTVLGRAGVPDVLASRSRGAFLEISR